MVKIMPSRIVASPQQLVDTLITAVEGGTGYWAYVQDYIWGSGDKDFKMGYGDNYASVTLIDMDTDKSYSVTVEIIALGWQRIMDGEVHVGSHILRYMLEDDVDSDAADCIVQAGLFNEVIYG